MKQIYVFLKLEVYVCNKRRKSENSAWATSDEFSQTSAHVFGRSSFTYYRHFHLLQYSTIKAVKKAKLLNTHPKPSSAVSNSTKAGVRAEPCRRMMSCGVVMDTRHLTRVKGTALASAERTKLRLIRYEPLSSLSANTLSIPKPSIDAVMLSIKDN